MAESFALTRARWPIALALVALASVGLWYTFAPDGERAVKDAQGPAPEALPARAPVRTLRPPVAPKRPSPAPDAKPKPPGLAQEHREVVGPGPNDPHEPGMLPHPLDEAHARIQAENNLIQSLNDAMSFRKVTEMRDMLVEYRRLDPSDIDANQLGYEVIADCIEFPGDASLTAAREFYDTQRHSPLRRFVRRICFENSN